MPILRKKKDEDEEEEQEEEKGKEKKRKTSVRKKKEPPKPWGRKERLLVLFILLLTAGTSSFLALSSRSFKLPGLPQIKKPKISFFGEETVVIEGDIKKQATAQEVIDYFNEVTNNLSGVYGLYVLDLETGFGYGVNESDIFEPASLNKLPVMMALLIEIEKGNLSLTDKYQLKAEDKVSGAGSLANKSVGYEVTLEELIILMGQQSDNSAFKIAKNILGEEVINQTIDDLGLVKTEILTNEQQTTPKDIGTYFQKLWSQELISTSSKEILLNSLTDTLYEDWLSKGAPEGVRVAHKFGREVNVVNDAGIIYLENPIVVVVMSQGIVESEADKAIPLIAQKIYQVNQY